MKNRIEVFLEDMSYNTKFEFLDEAKNKTEMQKVAAKRGIQLPAHDLAIFKGRYAYVDRMNKNKCTLPKEEVEKALNTLIGKAVDFDHLRKRVVGHWVDAYIEKDEIIAYGIFYKGNFKEEYNDVKELMDSDVLAISFEAWGNRNYGNGQEYRLSDIEFAGGALLMKTEPAFDGAEVFEMSNKERVLEFAKVMTPPEKFIHTGDLEKSYSCSCIKCGHKMSSGETHCKDLKCPKCGGQMRRTERPGPGQSNKEVPEIARFYIQDIAGIMRLISQVDCLSCKEQGFSDILMLDFENNKSKIKCYNCSAIMNIDLTPSARLVKKGRKIKKVALQDQKGNKTEKSSITTGFFVEKDIFEVFVSFEGEDERLEEAFMDEIEYANGCKIEESKMLTYKQRKAIPNEEFAVVKTIKIKTGKTRTIKLFPIHDPAHVSNALVILAQDKIKNTLRKLGISEDSVKNKILQRARSLKMKQLLESYKKDKVEDVLQEIAKATIERELTVEELEKAKIQVDGKENITEDMVKDIIKSFVKAKEKTDEEKAAEKKATDEKAAEKAKELTIENAKKEIEKLTADLKIANDKLAKIEKAEKDAKIKTRREELGESAKDMKDEDILDDLKFENAKLKKENADLKAGKPVGKKDLTKGSAEKGKTEEVVKRDKIQKYAFPE